MSAAPGGPFFWSLFFGQAKKSDLPWVSHPQVAIEIARKARDTIQDLDPRFRGDDDNVAGAEPPAINLLTRARSAHEKFPSTPIGLRR